MPGSIRAAGISVAGRSDGRTRRSSKKSLLPGKPGCSAMTGRPATLDSTRWRASEYCDGGPMVDSKTLSPGAAPSTIEGAANSRREFMQAAAALGLQVLAGPVLARAAGGSADVIIRNGRITTLDAKVLEVSSIALKDGVVLAVGS